MKYWLSDIKRRRSKIVGWAFATWGIVWLVVNSLSFFFKPVKAFVEDWNVQLFFGLLALAFLRALMLALAPRKILLPIDDENTTVEVEFGDLFQETSHIVVPVNEFFDGQLGDVIATSSVHGQFVQRYFGSDQRNFEGAVDNALGTAAFTTKSRALSRQRAYPLGTTAVLNLEGRKAFLVAITNTDPVTAKASSDLTRLFPALLALWNAIRHSSNGAPVSLPLVGSGLAGIPIEPQHLLLFILLSLKMGTRESKIISPIRIVLHPSLRQRIDLYQLEEQWGL